MTRKIISCQVFKPYLDLLNIKEVEYIDIKQHEKPKQLNKLLQTKINQNQNYTDIYLLYGICGNAILNLTTSHAKVHLLRVHDCLSVLLGSEKRRTQLFGHRPSQSWCCASYDADKEVILAQFKSLYGEENALYLLETLYPDCSTIVYINFNLPCDKKRIRELRKKQEVEVIDGNLSILTQLLNNNDNDFLTLKPNQKIELLYDSDQIMKIKEN